MKTNMKLPYGVSDFADLVNQNYYFVDRTNYIEKLENLHPKYLFHLRPRRFGKSLFISMLHYYYGLEHKEEFQALFGKYYIGKNPTPLANSYLIVKFDFTRINTKNYDLTYASFLNNVKKTIENCLKTYPQFFTAQDIKELWKQTEPTQCFQHLVSLVKYQTDKKLYVLIDEYDHFANELMAFRMNDYRSIIGQAGFVRKFYESIKVGTGEGVIDRIFITGVTPITLDSMTSGFNIRTDLTRDLEFTEMLGFTEEEVKDIFREFITKDEQFINNLLPTLKKWYNGYRFHRRANNTIYNPDMILYFVHKLQRFGTFPEDMIDTNIASDYSKVRSMFSIGDAEENYQTLQQLVEKKTALARVTSEFSFEKEFGYNDFISLLYYMGFLTIKESFGSLLSFRMPNYVIEKLYLTYFIHLLSSRNQLDIKEQSVNLAIIEMALNNNPHPFFQIIQNILQHLSNRDYQNFSEKYIKVIMMSTALLTDMYYVSSEREVKNGYIDVFFQERQPFPVNSQYLFELKYLKKTESSQLTKVKAAAKSQLLNYIQEETNLHELSNLQAWTIVVVKDEMNVEQVY